MLKKKLITFIAVLSLVSQTFAGDVNELLKSLKKEIEASPANAKTKQYAKKVLTSFSINPIFVEAVKSQNKTGLTLQQIKKIDREWIDAEEELPIHRKLMNNNAAREIKRLISKNPAIIEAFLMDNQGANVGQNDLTSDYWQGDEAKWQHAFNKGNGGLYVGKQKFDKSANQFLQQISVPVIDQDGSVVGAFCVGINISRL